MRAFLDSIKSPDEPFDFNRVIPMPRNLRHTSTGGRVFDGRKVTSWYVIDPDKSFVDSAHDKNERPFTADEESVLRDIGYTDWYA